MVNRLMYFAEVEDTKEIIYFYVTETIDFGEGQSIVQKIAPFTAAGRTLNLGRMPFSITKKLMLVNTSLSDTKIKSKEETLQQIFNVKRNRYKIQLIIPGLPLNITRFYIGDCDGGIAEPNRISLTVKFVEILEDNIKQTQQNLVLSNTMQNLKELLKQTSVV